MHIFYFHVLITGKPCLWWNCGLHSQDLKLYPASRVSFDPPRQIWKRKETLRATLRFPIEHVPIQMGPSFNQPRCQNMLIIKYWHVCTESTAMCWFHRSTCEHENLWKWFWPRQIQLRICPMSPALQKLQLHVQRLSITRDSAQKRLGKTLVLVDINHLGLLADLLEKSLKPCSGPLVKIVILVSVRWASSLNTLALNIPWNL